MKMSPLQFCELVYLAKLVEDNTDYCVFINYSGHVDRLEIEICESKLEYQKRVTEAAIKTNYRFDKKQFGEIKKMLTGILDYGEIDYDMHKLQRIQRV